MLEITDAPPALRNRSASPHVRAIQDAPPPLPALPNQLALQADEEQPIVQHGSPDGSRVLGTRRIGLQTTGHELRDLLHRAGHKGSHSRDLDGAEKLDLLVWIADQVKENVQNRTKMKLALKELRGFLEREGVSSPSSDAKSTIEKLLELRRRELARLDYTRYDEQVSADERFQLALVDMPAQEVTDCFAIVPWTEPQEDERRSRYCEVM